MRAVGTDQPAIACDWCRKMLSLLGTECFENRARSIEVFEELRCFGAMLWPNLSDFRHRQANARHSENRDGIGFASPR